MGLTTGPAGSADATATVLQNATGTGNPAGTAYTMDGNTIGLTVIVQGASAPAMNVDFTMSRDGGATYVATYVQDLVNVALGTALTTLALATSTTEKRYWFSRPPGYTLFRTPISSWAAGTLTVTVIESRRK